MRNGRPPNLTCCAILENDLASALVLHHDAANDSVLDDRLDRQRMQQQFDASLFEHLFEKDLEGLVIHLKAMAIFVARAFRDEALHDFVRNAADQQLMRGVRSACVDAAEAAHHRGGRGAAEKSITVHQQDARPAPRRRNSGAASGRSAAHHQHVDFSRDFQAARRFGDRIAVSLKRNRHVRSPPVEVWDQEDRAAGRRPD